MNRRDFLKITGLASIASVFPFAFSDVSHRLTLYGDGVHDDTEAVQAFIDGKDVFYPDGEKVGNDLSGTFRLTGPIRMNAADGLGDKRAIIGSQIIGDTQGRTIFHYDQIDDNAVRAFNNAIYGSIYEAPHFILLT